jgi:hypothetical protein
LKPTPKLLVLLGTLVGVLFFVSAGTAMAKGPACWKTLINDWYDGRIDNVYPVSCYQDALKHLPEDIQTYSSARDDIKAALASRLLNKKSSVIVPPVGGSGPKGGKSGPNVGPTPGRKTGSGPFQKVADKLKPKDATSVPIPLIVLAAIAGLLLAAGGAGFAARRMQARRLPKPSGHPPQT